jgi:hypothetical protein
MIKGYQFADLQVCSLSNTEDLFREPK